MKVTNTWQWVMIPAVKIDEIKNRKTVHVLLLIQETPYNKALFEVYGTGLRVERVKEIILN